MADHGVEPICNAMNSAGVPIAPLTYYAAPNRPPSARAVADERLKTESPLHLKNYGVYGIRNGYAQLARKGVTGIADRSPLERCSDTSGGGSRPRPV